MQRFRQSRCVRLPIIGLLACLAWSAACVAQAQLIGLSDEIILISKGANKKRTNRQMNQAGGMATTGQGLPRFNPSGRSGATVGRVNPARSSVSFRTGERSALAAISAPGPRIGPGPAPMAAAQRRPGVPEPPPLYGQLELPQGDEEGPPSGLTLDQAIERVVRANPELRSKAYDIDQARADVITAGLRGNPFYFLSASNFGYTPYSPSRPGNQGYSASIVQPFDINHKRQARSHAAAQARNVVEAQYRDAVRLAIDDLYTAYLEVIVARETVRYAETSLAGADELFHKVEAQLRGGAITDPDYLSIAIQREAAEVGVEQARAQLLEAQHALAAMLYVPADTAGHLALRGALRDRFPPPPSAEELTALALVARPDLAAFRLGIHRARADAVVARKEVIEDIYVIYSPYQFQNNTPLGSRNSTSFSFGLLGTIPLFNRNQGEIRRTQSNMVQAKVALAAVERQVRAEVERASVEYHASRQAVDRIEQNILPFSERQRRDVQRQYEAGDKSIIDYLNVRKTHNELVRQYRDAVIRHRRAMLRLNTAVGQRVLP
jgi:outer membrane protein, heavy metal efflux system